MVEIQSNQNSTIFYASSSHPFPSTHPAATAALIPSLFRDLASAGVARRYSWSRELVNGSTGIQVAGGNNFTTGPSESGPSNRSISLGVRVKVSSERASKNRSMTGTRHVLRRISVSVSWKSGASLQRRMVYSWFWSEDDIDDVTEFCVGRDKGLKHSESTTMKVNSLKCRSRRILVSVGPRRWPLKKE